MCNLHVKVLKVYDTQTLIMFHITGQQTVTQCVSIHVLVITYKIALGANLDKISVMKKKSICMVEDRECISGWW